MDPRDIQQVDQYRVVRFINAGGMAWVFEVEDPAKLRKALALKMLKPEFVSVPQYCMRFTREAQSVAQLDPHPNLVQVFGFGTDPQTRCPYFTMTLVDGSNLSQVIAEQEGRGLPLEQVSSIFLEILDALAVGHRAHLTHRDIKPGNILIRTRDGHAFLTDFGIAKAERDPSLTVTGGFAGTYQYASPEQIQGVTADPRSDVFSMGLTLYKALVGQTAYEKDPSISSSRDERIIVHLSKLEARGEELCFRFEDDVPPLVQRLIETACRIHPESRYRDAMDMQKSLRLALEGDSEGFELCQPPYRRAVDPRLIEHTEVPEPKRRDTSHSSDRPSQERGKQGEAISPREGSHSTDRRPRPSELIDDEDLEPREEPGPGLGGRRAVVGAVALAAVTALAVYFWQDISGVAKHGFGGAGEEASRSVAEASAAEETLKNLIEGAGKVGPDVDNLRASAHKALEEGTQALHYKAYPEATAQAQAAIRDFEAACKELDDKVFGPAAKDRVETATTRRVSLEKLINEAGGISSELEAESKTTEARCKKLEAIQTGASQCDVAEAQRSRESEAKECVLQIGEADRNIRKWVKDQSDQEQRRMEENRAKAFALTPKSRTFTEALAEADKLRDKARTEEPAGARVDYRQAVSAYAQALAQEQQQAQAVADLLKHADDERKGAGDKHAETLAKPLLDQAERELAAGKEAQAKAEWDAAQQDYTKAAQDFGSAKAAALVSSDKIREEANAKAVEIENKVKDLPECAQLSASDKQECVQLAGEPAALKGLIAKGAYSDATARASEDIGRLDAFLNKPPSITIDPVGPTLKVKVGEGIRLTANTNSTRRLDVTWLRGDQVLGKGGTITVPTDQAGRFEVTAVARDPAGREVKDTRQVEVEPKVGLTVALDPTPDRVQSGETVPIVARVSDSKVRVEILLNGKRVAAGPRWTFRATDAGTYTLVARAANNPDAKDTRQITVAAPAPAPLQITLLQPKRNVEVRQNELVPIVARVSDPKASVEIVRNGEVVARVGRWTFEATEPGTYTIIVRARDNPDINDRRQITVVPRPLQIALLQPKRNLEVGQNVPVPVVASVSDPKALVEILRNGEVVAHGPRWTFPATEPGTYTIVARASDNPDVKDERQITVRMSPSPVPEPTPSPAPEPIDLMKGKVRALESALRSCDTDWLAKNLPENVATPWISLCGVSPVRDVSVEHIEAQLVTPLTGKVTFTLSIQYKSGDGIPPDKDTYQAVMEKRDEWRFRKMKGSQ